MTLKTEFLEHIEYKFLAKVNDSQEILLKCNFQIMLESGILQEASLINMVSIHSFSKDIIKKKINQVQIRYLKSFGNFPRYGNSLPCKKAIRNLLEMKIGGSN